MKKPETRIQKKNRAAILSAGLDVFSQFGFRGATLDQIAEAAGLSKPNLLYYFPSKEEIHQQLLTSLLSTWLDPLRKMNDSGDPIEEILGYAKRKLALSRDFPRESRLFANEILQGAPRLGDSMPALNALVDKKATVINGWAKAGRIAAIDPYHLLFLIWAQTQHYADFDVQVRAVLGRDDPFPEAATFMEHMLRRTLAP
ncbi:MAG: TetR family transcriptional regulator C-terminal domain-containing protein [Yoonia sp.]|nr:TetR family transcriptional regulator C-terminal domain-containing protein [Yoonia sp.]MDG1864302.1 TetR family transcriptional regulator C-terminal domain-containing protein [Yoonia sp.]